MNHEVKHLRSQSELPKNEFERLNSGKIRLNEELRKCKTSRYEWVVTEKLGIAKDVYNVMDKVRRGGDIR